MTKLLKFQWSTNKKQGEKILKKIVINRMKANIKLIMKERQRINKISSKVIKTCMSDVNTNI